MGICQARQKQHAQINQQHKAKLQQSVSIQVQPQTMPPLKHSNSDNRQCGSHINPVRSKMQSSKNLIANEPDLQASRKASDQESNGTLQKSQQLISFEHQNIQKRGNFGDLYTLLTPNEQSNKFVIRVQNNITGQIRAAKVLNFRNKKTTKLIDQIQHLKSIDHPNLIQITELVSDNTQDYVIMEYCDGGTLKDQIQDIAQDQIKSLFQQIMNGLIALHSQEVWHLNLQPDNILFTSDSHSMLKLASYGALRKIKSLHSQQNNDIIYCSPDFLKQQISQQCDIWSAGVILYELITGEHPFDLESKELTITAINEGLSDDQIKKLQQIDEVAAHLIKKMLVIDPKDRITAQDVANHHYLKKQISNGIVRSSTISNMKSYNRKNQLQFILHLYMVDKMISNEEREKLALGFQVIDTDGDGKINKINLMQHFKDNQGNLQDLDRVFAILDLDGDQSIQFKEFLTATCNKENLLTETKLRQFYDIISTNKSQGLSMKDFKKLFYNTNMDANDWLLLFSVAQFNKDGFLPFDKFKQFMMM